MPLFDYACRDCGHRFEALVQGRSKPACPECAGRKLEKQLAAFAVSSGRPDPAPAPGGCGTCGDPRGPGSCRS